MLASLESRVARLERLQPQPLPDVRVLDRRAPYSWLPRGVQRLTKKQSEIFLSPARFRCVVAGRRGGKTTLAIAELLRSARAGRNKECWYVAPSFRMCKQILWGPLKSAIPATWMSHKSEVDLSLTLRGYDSTVRLRSSDDPDSLRGAGLDLAILDEFSSMNPVVWSEVIRPALADKQGQAIIQGSPRGYNALYDLYSQALETDDWAGFKFSTADGGLVPPEEIEAVRSALDPRTFAQEFDADFAQSIGRVFLMFERANVRADIHDLGATPPADTWAAAQWQRPALVAGLDFNVNPLSCVVGQIVGDELHIFDEVALSNADTAMMGEALRQKYPGRKLIVYPDPTGRARKTSAVGGMTDFRLLEQSGFEVRAPSAPYAVVDRVNSTNALLCNVHGRRRLFIHPRCKRLIESLERLAYHDGTSVIDKSQGWDHFTEACGYLVMGTFPIAPPKVGEARIRFAV